MRGWLAGFLCGALLFGALPLLAEDVLRITPGGAEPLQDRVTQLEKAVAQLQAQVYGPAAPAAPKVPTGAETKGYGVTCMIETKFDGAFSANAPTETEARDLTVQKCRDKLKTSIYCTKREVKCAR